MTLDLRHLRVDFNYIQEVNGDVADDHNTERLAICSASISQ